MREEAELKAKQEILYWLCKAKLEWDRTRAPITYAQGYELGSDGYADRRAGFSRQIFEQPFLRSIFRDGQTILDVGSGRGASAAGLFELPFDVRICLTEPSFGELKHAPGRFSGNVSKLFAAINTRAECLPFRDNSFDVVTLVDVFEHIVAWKESLREIHRVLHSDGYVYLQFPFATNAHHAHLGDLVRYAHVELYFDREPIVKVYERL